MKLENTTVVPATLVSAAPGEVNEVPAFVIAKVTYDIQPTGALKPAQDNLPISAAPLATPFGTFHGEIFPRKDRADFVVLGTVRLPSPREQVVVSARLGSFTSRLRVTGERVWTSHGRSEPIASAPRTFTEMPIAYTHAFGGTSPSPMGQLAWPNNPEGQGFYQSEGDAVGKPLPNVEWAEGQPIRSWRDRPDPAGWGPYPMFWGLRASQAVLTDSAKNVSGISRKAFNHAHPTMVVDAISPGDRVEVRGLRTQPTAFEVPPLKLVLRWTCGPDQGEAVLVRDGLYLWIDQQKVVLTHRARFRYPFRPEERRFTILFAEAT